MQRTLFGDDVAVMEPTGAQLRDVGIQRASQNADSLIPNWTDRALQFVRRYPHAEFKTENIREFAYSNGLQKPDDDRSWGAVMRMASRSGLIAFSRYEAVNDPKAHCRPATVWRKVAS